jgi:preprotein translocase subunit SecD
MEKWRIYIAIVRESICLGNTDMTRLIFLKLIQGFFFAGLAFSSTSALALESGRVTCISSNNESRIALDARGRRIFLLTVNNVTLTESDCPAIASRLENAINAENLDSLMLVADPDRGVCIVRSTQQGCRSEARIFNTPRNTPLDEFMQSILNIKAESFFFGDSSQHTDRRYYVRLGRALIDIVE